MLPVSSQPILPSIQVVECLWEESGISYSYNINEELILRARKRSRELIRGLKESV